MPLILVALFALASSCGSDSSQRSSAPRPGNEMESTPNYDLHEWGLITTSPRGFELGAGPGQRVTPDMMLVVDKPILYVHADTAFELSIQVTPRAGLIFAERWPPMTDDAWAVSVSPDACRAQHTYPSTCSAPDGYCEVAELALYETDDAACLRAGEHLLPLLFYRMRHDGPGPALPLAFEKSGDAIVVHNRSWSGGIGALWRVSWDGQTGATHAARADVPARGASTSIARPTTGGVQAARAALRADLGEHGLTAHETDAFMRAWDEALFGESATSDRRTPQDREDGDDGTPVDGPVQVNDETVDSLTNEIPTIEGGPRIADVLLYWLPRADIDALAAIDAQPAPRALRRAILVRADVR